MSGRALLQHLQIAAQFVRIGVIRKAQFRVEFLIQVLMDCCWYASHVSVFEVLYSHVPSIAGWRSQDCRLLLGFLFVSDAFMMIWLGNSWRFGRDLKDGKLDPVRARPASALFLYMFQQFSPEGCVNLFLAMGYLVYGVHCADRPLTLGLVATVPVAVLLSFWARTTVIVLFAAIELRLLGSDVARFFYELVHATSDRPLDIFSQRVRLFLLYVIPVGALTQVPASLVLGRYTLAEGVLAVAWLIALGVLVFAAWNRGFARYESAMG